MPQGGNPDNLLLNEVKTIEDIQKIRYGLGRDDDFIAISSFENGTGNLEAGILSRFPLTEVIEFDPFPEPNQSFLEQRRLERPNIAGITNVNTDRGFQEARIPALNLIVIAAPLKSSRGSADNTDRSNAEKRKLVAAWVADRVNRLIEDHPRTTVAVMGDFNVGVLDESKNGIDLAVDEVTGTGDRYDEAHALLKDGLVDGLRMKSLAKDLEGAFVGNDDVPDFPGAGAIDVIYVVEPGAEEYSAAQRASSPFGSDHRSVFAVAGAALPTVNIATKRLLPNPDESDPRNETITIENTGAALTVTGWKFRDVGGNTFSIINALAPPTPPTQETVCDGR